MPRLWTAELRLLLADLRVRLVAAGVVLLMSATFLLNLGEARRFSAEAAEAAAVERARWLGQDPKNPHSAAHYGVWVFKPSSPLAVLEPGVEPYVGRMIRIEAHRYNDALFRSAQDRTPLARAGVDAPADVLHLVGPLFAILLGFSAFAADRERGTLRLALGNGVSPARLLAARVGALLAVTALIVGLPALALGGAANLLLATDGWQAWPRLLLWTGAQIAYAAVFLFIAVLASLLLKTARGALAVSLAVWAVLCIAAPRLAAVGVEALAPTPSYAAVRARIEAEIKRYNAAELHQARQEALLARYGAEDAAALPVDLRGAMLHDREQHDYRAFDRGLGPFFARLAEQDRLQGLAGVMSPMVAMQAVSEGLAGSDHRRHADFLGAAERYRRVLSDTMNLDLVRNPARGGAYLATREVWEKVPPFAYQPAPLGRSLAEAAAPLAILLLWLAAAAGLTAVAARRLEP